jgi:zinc transporter 2
MLAEFAGGIYAGSLAIVSDAAHLFSDLSGFFISIVSIKLAKREKSKKLSFGYHRAEILGAMCSIMIIWAITIALVAEGVERIIDEYKIILII